MFIGTNVTEIFRRGSLRVVIQLGRFPVVQNRTSKASCAGQSLTVISSRDGWSFGSVHGWFPETYWMPRESARSVVAREGGVPSSSLLHEQLKEANRRTCLMSQRPGLQQKLHMHHVELQAIQARIDDLEAEADEHRVEIARAQQDLADLDAALATHRGAPSSGTSFPLQRQDAVQSASAQS